MKYTLDDKRIAYRRLPEDIRDLIMSNESTELVTDAIKEVGITEDQADKADSEILYALYCLQSLDEAMDNIAQISGKNPNDLSRLREVVQDGILSKYTVDINEFIEINKSSPVEKIPPPSDIQTKEPIVITKETKEEALKELDRRSIQNQNSQTTQAKVPEIAPNNLPMVEEGEKVHDAPHVDHPVTPPMPPKPTVKPEAKPEAKSELPKASLPDYRYPGGKDPYREPLV